MDFNSSTLFYINNIVPSKIAFYTFPDIYNSWKLQSVESTNHNAYFLGKIEVKMDCFGFIYAFMHGIQETTKNCFHIMFGSQSDLVFLLRMTKLVDLWIFWDVKTTQNSVVKITQCPECWSKDAFMLDLTKLFKTENILLATQLV